MSHIHKNPNKPQNPTRWNSNGTHIVSGSDDCHLGIWKMNFQHKQECQLLCNFASGHDRNIFHAIFIPFTNDDEILSCALDCDVRYNYISKGHSVRIGTHDRSCHKLDIIDPTTFISCSEDGTVRLMDKVM